MKKIIFICFLLSTKSFSAELDVLIARTSLALGEEYGKISNSYRDEMQRISALRPDIINTDDISLLETSGYAEALQNFEVFKNLALDEFKLVFCENDCPSTINENGLELEEKYNFLRREAFVRYESLILGAGSRAVITRYAPIYAANSNFEEHLLGRLTRLVEQQQRLDTEGRRLANQYNQLKASFVDEDNAEIVGVDQQILREENYVRDVQTQIVGYQGCIGTSQSEFDFEKNELSNSMKQLRVMELNSMKSFEEIYNFTYESPNEDDFVEVQANQPWQLASFELEGNERLLITANGQWNVRGAALNFNEGDLYMGLGRINPDADYPSAVFGGLNAALEAIISKSVNQGDSYMIPTKYPFLISSAFREIAKGGDTGPLGYVWSGSSSMGESEGSGTSVNGGVTFYGVVSVGGGVSESFSTSVGRSYGMTSAIKLNTTVAPLYPFGSLIGSLCAVHPSTDINCKRFLVGNGTAVDNPSGLPLWLRANDNEAVGFNVGIMRVQVRKQTTFKTYWDQYESWFSNNCDSDGTNCGLGYILENIAYIPNPYTAAKSTVVKQFPNFPDAVINLILQNVNYLIEMKIVSRDIKTKELSMENNSTKIANCRSQLEDSQAKLENTRELIATYQRRIQNVKTKKILLESSRRYYEDELASINNVREKNLDRIRRYYELTVASYNYLYLDNFRAEGAPQPYYEGDYYRSQIDLMEDLILEITAVNDLLNPNRGYVVHQLTQDELNILTNPDFRQRKLQVKLDYNNFFCQGFNIENQARVMIEKVGVLLDVDPAREHLFFKNPNRRNTQVQVTHGLENRFYNFNGREEEFWMPSQKRNVAGYSTRVLVDANSDYFELRDSRFFERFSFRKTSFATNWKLEMLDPSIRMYESSDTNHENPLLKGAKLVFWFNSAEIQGEGQLNQCLIPPYELAGVVNANEKPELSWKFPVDDIDYSSIERFTVYRSLTPNHGFKPISHVKVNDCTINSGDLECAFEDTISTNGTYYYQIKSSYEGSQKIGTFLDGIPSDTVQVSF